MPEPERLSSVVGQEQAMVAASFSSTAFAWAERWTPKYSNNDWSSFQGAWRVIDVHDFPFVTSA
jgi:hypothetical protein